jgi:hypothetical protein
MDTELVAAAARWWSGWEDGYRGAGAVGPAVQLGPEASAQDRLLASFGRDPSWQPVE